MGFQNLVYKKFSRIFHVLSVLLVSVLAAVILVSSLVPAGPSMSVNNADKILHISAYFTLGFVAYFAFRRFSPIFVWIGLCIYGAAIEGLQGISHIGRSADILDALANASGALLALLFWVILTYMVTFFAKYAKKENQVAE